MNYKYIKYKSNDKNQIGGGFKDDISIFGSYAVYAHGMVDKTNQFTLPANKNVIYFEEFGQPMNSRKAIAIWKFFNTINNNSISVLLKLASGCIDDEVKNYEIDRVKPFSVVRFKPGGSTINDLDIYFMPLTSGDIFSNKEIDPNNEVIKSGVYSVPIGFNYPFKDYCNNLGSDGSMLFKDYINKFKSADNRILKDIPDIKIQNTFTKFSGDSYKCGLIGDIGKKVVNIKDVCIKETECDIQHKILYNNIIGKPVFPDKPEFINEEYKYKAIRLSELLTKQLKDDIFKGTYFIITCRSSHLNQLEKDIKHPEADIYKIQSDIKTIKETRIKSLALSQEIPFVKCTDIDSQKRNLLGLNVIKNIIDKLAIKYNSLTLENKNKINTEFKKQLDMLLIPYNKETYVPFENFNVIDETKKTSKRDRIIIFIDKYIDREKDSKKSEPRNPGNVISYVITDLLKLYTLL